MPAILYKKVKVNDLFYIYLTVPNAIIKVDEAFFRLFELYFKSKSRNDFIDNACLSGYKLETANRVYDSYLKAGSEGLFKSFHSCIDVPYTKDEIVHILSHGLPGICLCLTYDCNFRCKYCIYGGGFINERTHSTVSMSRDVARKSVDFLVDHSDKFTEISRSGAYGYNPTKRNISFYGGEPLLEKELMKWVVEYASLRGDFRHNFTTNLSLIDDATIDFIVKYNMSVTISLDGPKPVHDKHRVFKSNKPTYDYIMSKFGKFKDRAGEEFIRQKVNVNATMTSPLDYKAVKLFFDEFITNHGISLNISYARQSNLDLKSLNSKNEETPKNGNYLRKALLSQKKEHMNMEPFLRAIYGATLYKWKNRPIYNSLQEGKKSCHAGPCFPIGLSRLYVNPNGLFRPCERIPEIDLFDIGNVNDGFDYDKIYTIMDRFISLNREKCRECWCYSMCPNCYQDFISDNENPDFDKRKAELRCVKTREALENELKLYCDVFQNAPDVLREYTVKNKDAEY